LLNEEHVKLSVHEKLSSYAKKLQNAPVRKRGNPGWYLRLVEQVKQKRCTQCNTTKHVELHHVNGDWRNPFLYNVEWLCATHHQQADNFLQQHYKEKHMSKQRSYWTSERIQKMQTFYAEHCPSHTLEWCHANFNSGEKSTPGSNKGAWRKYGNLKNTGNALNMTRNKGTSRNSITLTELVEYRRWAERSGYHIILD
jgi:hypothetical protein